MQKQEEGGMGDGRWKMGDGGGEMAEGRWRREDGGGKMEEGRWRREDGGGKMEEGRRYYGILMTGMASNFKPGYH